MFNRAFGLNLVLAFIAGFMATFGAFIAATPKDPGVSAIIAAAAAGVYTGFRAVVALIAAKAADTEPK